MDDEIDDATLRSALDGDPGALERMYWCYRDAVLRAVSKRLARFRDPRIDRAEVVQEVWVHLLDQHCRRLKGYDRDRGRLRNFIMLLAGNQAWVIAMRICKRPPEIEPADEDEDDGAGGSVHRIGDEYLRVDFLRRCLERAELSPSDEELFDRVLMEGKTSAEVAAELGLKVKTVEQRRCRMIRKLRKAATELLNEESEGRSVSPLALALLVAAAFMLFGDDDLERPKASTSSEAHH